MILEVAIPAPIHGTFSYSADQELSPGSRVEVPFGRQKLVGVVLGLQSEVASTGKNKNFKLREISRIVDDTPVYSSTMLALAEWMSKYYLCPIGEVLRSMLPAGVKTQRKSVFELLEKETDDPLYAQLVDVFSKQSGQMSEAKLLRALKALNIEDQPDPKESLALLVEKNWIRLRPLKEKKARSQKASELENKSDFVDSIASFRAKERLLKPRQHDALQLILEKGIRQDVAGKKPVLIRGVTGSGKTEIYLQAICRCMELAEQKSSLLPQSLVLVPEISLTPQMTNIFIDRFGDRVAVVHSALSDLERWRQLERIRNGDALILIGPRSAVFGPFANLKLIIIDEEHDSSYKQATGLSYHGRDVAIVRAKLEGATVVLGSATPSLESYFNATEGKYHLIELPERVSGLPLPEVRFVSNQSKNQEAQFIQSSAQLNALIKGQDAKVSISQEIVSELRQNLKEKKQSIVLVNRRGYAFYLFSLEKSRAWGCPNCSISLTLHRRSSLLKCHYCDYSITTMRVIEENPNDRFLMVGFGSEKLEIVLKELIPEAKIARLDSDTASKKGALTAILDDFRRGAIDILVGTQILAKGHDFPNVTLMVILDVDQLLDLPDFRASERTFQLMVQAAGRAGRADSPGRVIIQCSRTQDPVIQRALNQDYLGFATGELAHRKMCRYPPYQRMALVEFSSVDQSLLVDFEQRVVGWLEKLALDQPELPKLVRIVGPSTPAIEQIRNRFRRALLLTSARVDALHSLAKQLQLAFVKLPGDLKLKIDIDPQNLV